MSPAVTGCRRRAPAFRAARSAVLSRLSAASSARLVALLALVVGVAWLLFGHGGGKAPQPPVAMRLTVAPATTGGSSSTGGSVVGASTSTGTPQLALSRGGTTTNAAFLNVTNLAAGASRVASVTVVNQGGAVLVTLAGTNITHRGPAGSGDLGRVLQLTVRDATSKALLYDGPFEAFTSPVQVCGTGGGNTCRRWAPGESHDFTFTVLLPQSVGNAYQATSVGADYEWSAS